jgi:hypothetical protein
MTNRSESRAKGPTRDDFKAPCIPLDIAARRGRARD